MAIFHKFDCVTENLCEKVHNFASDDLRVMLTNTQPVVANALKSDITELSAANGYSTGGVAMVQSSSAQSGGIYRLITADGVFTASGGNIGPWQWAVLFNNTPTSPLKPLIGWWDYGGAVTILTGASFTIDADATLGIFTLGA